MAWPAVVKSGLNTESWHTVISSDFLPTMLEVLGVSRPASQQAWAMDGVSQLSFLKGEPVAPRCIGHLFADGACSLRSFVHGCTHESLSGWLFCREQQRLPLWEVEDRQRDPLLLGRRLLLRPNALYVHRARLFVVVVVHDDDAQAVCADDLEADLGERTDLAQQEPEILASMVANLTAWWESVRHSIAAESKCPNDPTTGHGRPSRSIPVRPIQSHPAGC